MSIRTIGPLLALSAALLLGACAGGAVVGNVPAAGVPSVFAYAAHDRDFLVVIIGNPYVLPKRQTDAAITGALPRNHYGVRTNYTTRSTDKTRESFRFVMIFNPPAGLASHRLCGDTAQLKSDASSGRNTLEAVFCADDVVQSEAVATLPLGMAPRDAGFRRIIDEIARTLVPPVDPHREPARECMWPTC